MTWIVKFHARFDDEFRAFPLDARKAIAARIGLLARQGPSLGRPNVDTLSGSRHANMKELRCPTADGAWRIAFAFDPERRAIMLVGGDKAGVKEKRFYRSLIATADERFEEHLLRLKEEGDGKNV